MKKNLFDLKTSVSQEFFKNTKTVYIDKTKFKIYTILFALSIILAIFNFDSLLLVNDYSRLSRIEKAKTTKEYKILKQQIDFYQNRIDVKLKELEQLNNTLINKKQEQIDFNMDKLEVEKLELKQYLLKR